MASIRDFFQFVMYWFLTYIFGTFCFTYFTLCNIFGRNTVAEERGKKMQPACLTDASYGCHKYFKSQGVKLHYVDCGKKDAKLVILIHGTPGFWFCWRKQIPELSNYFRVIALDLRGCGDSENPNQRGSYGKEMIIQDIIHLIGSLECSSAHVICSETSGYLGWELASNYPHLVSKLVFLNAPHPSVLYQLFHLKSYYYFKYWYLLFLQIPFLPELMTSKDQTNGWLDSLLDPPLKAKAITEQEIDAYKYTFSRKDDWSGVINHLRQIDLRPLISQIPTSVIATPTLLLMGSAHPYLTVDAAYRSAELVERIKIRIIPNARNNLQVTHFKKANEELIDFLVDKRPLSVKSEPSSSLVGRVFGAVTSPYAMKTTDVVSLSNGLKEAAQNTITSGVNLAQNVWPGKYKQNCNKVSQISY